MEINIGNKTITSTDFSNAETAWMIEDAILVLEYLKNVNVKPNSAFCGARRQLVRWPTAVERR